MLFSMFTNEKSPGADFPELRGKANECKKLLPIIRDLSLQKAWSRIDYEQSILKCLNSLVDCYAALDTVDAHGKNVYYLPPDQIKKLRESIDTFLLHYNYIRHVAQVENGRKLWLAVPKFHKLWHIGFESQFMNPNIAKCYGGEDLMRIVKIIANYCRHGLQSAYRSKNIMENYCFGPCIRMHHEK